MAEQGVNGVGGRLQAVLLSMQSCTDERAADGIRTHDLLHGKQTL
jgi:hypothetical protein